MKVQSKLDSPCFIPLNNKHIAEYSLVYHLNDAYSIRNLSQIQNKHQAFFQRLEIKNQQLNLMYVDSIFVNILADLALDVLLNNVKTFNQYIETQFKIRLVRKEDETRYFQKKFSDFIQLILYSNIGEKNISDGKISTDRVFCFKNNQNQLEYYSIYEQYDLQQKLMSELKLTINKSATKIQNHELKLVLKMTI